MYNPQAFPTEGPRSMRFVAYDPDKYDVCSDEDCDCRASDSNTCGYGATPEEAIADFWEQLGIEPPSAFIRQGEIDRENEAMGGQVNDKTF